MHALAGATDVTVAFAIKNCLCGGNMRQSLCNHTSRYNGHTGMIIISIAAGLHVTPLLLLQHVGPAKNSLQTTKAMHSEF
jgi:hypothetical protein